MLIIYFFFLYVVLFVTFKHIVILQQSIPWMATREEAWHALCHYWSTDEFKNTSQRNRGNRGSESYHTYGGDGHLRLAKHIISESINFYFQMNVIAFIYQ